MVGHQEPHPDSRPFRPIATDSHSQLLFDNSQYCTGVDYDAVQFHRRLCRLVLGLIARSDSLNFAMGLSRSQNFDSWLRHCTRQTDTETDWLTDWQSKNVRRLITGVTPNKLPFGIVWIADVCRMTYHDVACNSACKPHDRHILRFDTVHTHTTCCQLLYTAAGMQSSTLGLDLEAPRGQFLWLWPWPWPWKLHWHILALPWNVRKVIKLIIAIITNY